jgi:hypothetical protein
MMLFRKILFFCTIVWRPVTGDPGDTWLMAWRKYKLAPQSAWEIAGILYSKAI